MLIVTIILASALILPVSMSYAQGSNGTMTMPGNQTGMNQTMTMSTNSTNENSTIGINDHATVTMHTNSTGTVANISPVVNSTATQSKYVQSAQQVSTFIHSAVADFKQQGDDTRKVMLDCVARVQSAAPSDIDSIKQDCSIQLNAITAKYQNERAQYHNLIKEYRSSVMVFLNDARGVSVSPTAVDSAVTQLGMMMMQNAVMTNSTMTAGSNSTVNNTR